jgi:hypothetical protein
VASCFPSLPGTSLLSLSVPLLTHSISLSSFSRSGAEVWYLLYYQKILDASQAPMDVCKMQMHLTRGRRPSVVCGARAPGSGSTRGAVRISASATRCSAAQSTEITPSIRPLAGKGRGHGL